MDEALKNDLFLLLGYLITSACGLYDEPQGYGPFRLMDASGRLLTILNTHWLSDPFLEDLEKAIEKERFGVSTDEQLRAFLDQCALKYTQEMMGRMKSWPDDPADDKMPY